MSVVIGPPATHLLFENADVKVWMMDVAPGETYPHHYHDHDYVLFYTTDVLATVHDEAPSEHTEVWNARYDHGDGAPAAGIWTYAHSVFFIPGTGFLSPGFINIGPTPMVAPLVEITRPRRDDQAQLGFARSDALIGLSPAPTARLLENDRMTVSYTAIAPGGDAVLGAQRESAVCVIDGGELRGERGDVTTVAARTGSWRGAGQQRVVNVGSTTYRELSVELK
jgi:hypothetical protein